MSRLIKSATSCQKYDSIKSKYLAEILEYRRSPKLLFSTLPGKRIQRVPGKCVWACEVILWGRCWWWGLAQTPDLSDCRGWRGSGESSPPTWKICFTFSCLVCFNTDLITFHPLPRRPRRVEIVWGDRGEARAYIQRVESRAGKMIPREWDKVAKLFSKQWQCI